MIWGIRNDREMKGNNGKWGKAIPKDTRYVNQKNNDLQELFDKIWKEFNVVYKDDSYICDAISEQQLPVLIRKIEAYTHRTMAECEKKRIYYMTMGDLIEMYMIK